MIKHYDFIGAFYRGSVAIELSDANVPFVGVVQYDDRMIVVVTEDLSAGQITTMGSVINNYDIDGLATKKAKRLEVIRTNTGLVIDAGGEDNGEEQNLIDLILAATNRAELDAVIDVRI